MDWLWYAQDISPSEPTAASTAMLSCIGDMGYSGCWFGCDMHSRHEDIAPPYTSQSSFSSLSPSDGLSDESETSSERSDISLLNRQSAAPCSGFPAPRRSSTGGHVWLSLAAPSVLRGAASGLLLVLNLEVTQQSHMAFDTTIAGSIYGIINIIIMTFN